jgi:hypothetical protein
MKKRRSKGVQHIRDIQRERRNITKAVKNRLQGIPSIMVFMADAVPKDGEIVLPRRSVVLSQAEAATVFVMTYERRLYSSDFRV